MSNSSVESQANHLAGEVDDVAKTLSRALEETPPLESSVALLASVLGDVGPPLTSALEILREIEWLRDQADDVAQERAKSLLDDVIRIVSSAKDGLLAAERYQQAALEQAKRLADVVGSAGASGCAEALGKAAGKASGLYEAAKSGHQTLKNSMGPRNESVKLAGKLRKRAKTAERAVNQACDSATAACDTISEFKGAVDTLQIPPSAPLETVLPQLQALNLASSDPLPDLSDLEQLAVQSKKSHKDVSKLPAVEGIGAKISSAKEKIDQASGKLRAV